MDRPTAWGPIVAALAALLALIVLAAPAAAATGAVATGSQVAEEPTTHEFTLDPATGGNVSDVNVRYRSGVDLADATVAVGVDRDGDGTVDARLDTARVSVGDRGIEATLEETHEVASEDAVVIEVRDVRNPTATGSHAAEVGATVDGATDRTTVTYRVTPFRSDDTEFRDVSVPGSSFQFTYAAGSTFADATLVGAHWTAVSFSDAVLTDVRGVDDAWTRVTVEDTTASGLHTERTAFDGVTVSGAAVSDVASTQDAWTNVDVRDSSLHAVDSRESTYSDVQFSGARVDGFSTASSTLENVVIRPAAAEAADDGNVSDVTAGERNGTVSANVSLDGPAPSDDSVDGAVADVRGNRPAPNRTVSNVTLQDAAMRNVTVADGAFVDVRMENAALRNVTLENVTLRGVTLSGAVYADGTLTDEVITSEEELRQELLVGEIAGRAGDGDLEAGASATPADGDASADDGGLVDGATAGIGA